MDVHGLFNVEYVPWCAPGVTALETEQLPFEVTLMACSDAGLVKLIGGESSCPAPAMGVCVAGVIVLGAGLSRWGVCRAAFQGRKVSTMSFSLIIRYSSLHARR